MPRLLYGGVNGFMKPDYNCEEGMLMEHIAKAPPILHSEVPLVYTSMYKWIIDDSDFVVRAARSGKIAKKFTII